MMISKKIKKCRISNDTNLILVSKFPKLALTGTFLRKGEKTIKTSIYKYFYYNLKNNKRHMFSD
jgi:hypothetical protein